MSGALRRLVVLAAAAGMGALVLPRSPATETRLPAPTSSEAQSTFIGVAGCAAMACHGGTRPNERGEYTTWIQHDRHARAFTVLFDELSQRIAKNLDIARPEGDNRCLVCHSTAVGRPRGPRFSSEDGVGCEACHGAAEKWLVPHSRPDWKKRSDQDKIGSQGMTRTKDVLVRASVCVTCHVGAPGQDVNHDLIAAGHPPLSFELDAFTANMPPHWREAPDKTATFGAQAWAVGQAVMLKQSLELLHERASRGQWPEFAEFECYACHHDLKENSWRQQLGFGDRRPGTPVWSSPQWLLTQRLAESTGKQSAGTNEFGLLRQLLGRGTVPAAEVAAAAAKAATASGPIAGQVAQEKWDSARLRTLLGALAAEPDSASLDYATASQLTMALGAVFEAIARAETTASSSANPSAAKIRPSLDRLYDDVQQAKGFDAQKFLVDLKSFREVARP